MRRLIIGLGLLALAMLAVALGSISDVRPARAASGDSLGVITRPAGCGGIGVAFDGTNVLYTCAGENKVRKTDLASADHGFVDTADSLGSPVSVDAIAWDPNQTPPGGGAAGALWGGDLDGAGNCRIWTINTATGLAQVEFSYVDPHGGCNFSFYDGLTVDTVTNTLYLSPDVHQLIHHVNKNGTAAANDNIPFETLTTGECPFAQSFGFVGCLNSGLAIGLDGNLFAGTNGDGKIYRLDPVTPALLGQFSTVTGRDEDLECGPRTASGLETILSADLLSSKIDVLEAPAGTCVSPVSNPRIVKTPRLANLWLCQPVASCANPSSGIGQRDFNVELGGPITSVSPKGEPQTIGSFEFEVRYDRKLVNVTVDAGEIFDRTGASCATIAGQGFVQFRCNIKGKPTDAPTGPGVLAVVHVRPTADVYSMVIPSQENGIATQLINQDCQLSDLQGHPIKTSLCSDADVTLRSLEGDLNGDCSVDVRDQQEEAFRWGSHTGQLLYNSRFDLEPSAPKLGDGDIDAKDLQVVFGRHGSTCGHPWPAQLPVNPKATPPPTATPPLCRC